MPLIPVQHHVITVDERRPAGRASPDAHRIEKDDISRREKGRAEGGLDQVTHTIRR